MGILGDCPILGARLDYTGLDHTGHGHPGLDYPCPLPLWLLSETYDKAGQPVSRPFYPTYVSRNASNLTEGCELLLGRVALSNCSQVLANLINTEVWSGLSDAAEEGVWRDPEGAATVPTPTEAQGSSGWLDGEPDGGAAENCAALQWHGARDEDCSLAKP
ncbi:CD209 antigen-like, partial [Pollicipes pollicipes]|uniref:CD209 antigen-like n=1 Tax=Pollicipes pollicipes TaxID=41117 RepID=UPI001884B094